MWTYIAIWIKFTKGTNTSVLALKDCLSREQHGTRLQFLICYVFPYQWCTKKHLLGVSFFIFGTVGVHPHFVQPD